MLQQAPPIYLLNNITHFFIYQKNNYLHIVAINWSEVWVNENFTCKILLKVNYRYPELVNRRIYQIIKQNKITVKSITTDNGFEFTKLGMVAKHYGVKLYKCDPYCSFQRGTNEHFNGILRRCIKNGTQLLPFSESKLFEYTNLINTMPRELFNFLSAAEMHVKIALK